MWGRRVDQPEDVTLVVDLDPVRCLDAADFLARHACRYGIDARLELRRNRSGSAYDRHFVLCRPPIRRTVDQGAASGEGDDSRPAPPWWIMHLVFTAHHPEETRVVLGMRADRLAGRRAAGRRAAAQYQGLLFDALLLLDERRRQRPQGHRHDNVIALRPFSDLPPTG